MKPITFNKHTRDLYITDEGVQVKRFHGGWLVKDPGNKDCNGTYHAKTLAAAKGMAVTHIRKWYG
jgi:hypothetical protein